MQGASVGAVRFAEPQYTIRQIIDVVADFYELTAIDLMSSRRTWEITKARWIAMHLSNKLTSKPNTTIGRAFGDKDHSTVMYAIKRIRPMIKDDPRLADEVELIQLRLEKAHG